MIQVCVSIARYIKEVIHKSGRFSLIVAFWILQFWWEKWITLLFYYCFCVLFPSITESFKSSWILIPQGCEILFWWYLVTLSCKFKRTTLISIFSLSQAQHKPRSDATERIWKMWKFQGTGNCNRFPAFLWIYEDIKLHKCGGRQWKMRPLKDSERLASSYMYGEKKDIVQRQQIKQKNCIKKPGSTGFSKTDSSDKPHMCGNKKHIFNLHIVLGNLFFFICWETSRNCVGYRGTVTRISKRWSTPSSPGSEFLYVLQGNSASTSTCFSS